MYQKKDLHANLTKQASEARMLEDGIPEVEEQMASKLWEAIRYHVDEERSSMATPPFSFINLNDENSFHWEERKALQENNGIPPTYKSKKAPSHLTYGGRSEHNSYIITAPSLHRPWELLKEKNVLLSLLSMPISCTLTLEEVLRRQPDLWCEVANFLVSKKGHNHSRTTNHRANKDVTSEHSSFRDPLSIKKVGKTNEHIQGHTT